MTMQEILQIEDIDQRMQAIKYCRQGLREFYQSQGGELIDSYAKFDLQNRKIRYELWRIPKGNIFNKDVFFALYECPTARARGETKEYAKGVPDVKTIAEAMAWGMSDEISAVTPEEWAALVPLKDEA